MPKEYGADDYNENVFSGQLSRLIDTDIFSYLPNVFPQLTATLTHTTQSLTDLMVPSPTQNFHDKSSKQKEKT